MAELPSPAGAAPLATADACGRVLASALNAPLDLPPFPSSAMDGYALLARDLDGEPPYQLRCVGSSLAGHPYAGDLQAGECLRITTGAMLPEVADTVVAQEDCEVEDAMVSVTLKPDAAAHVRPRGNDVEAGAPLLDASRTLTAFDIAWLAASGVEQVPVFPKPRIAVFATGDELAEPGRSLQPGQIYESNRRVLLELLDALPATVSDLGILKDEPAAIEQALRNAARDHDLLLTSGGVSVGTADYLKEVVSALGSLSLWRLNLKPGKPLAFGHVGACPFLGLPGNPVSTIVTFLLVARPAILTLAGARVTPPLRFRARLVTALKHTPGREEYQRGALREGSEGPEVAVTGDQSSNRLATFSNADCLIRVPKDVGSLEVGAEVEVLPFRGLAS